jgi:CHAT domain-containing protein
VDLRGYLTGYLVRRHRKAKQSAQSKRDELGIMEPGPWVAERSPVCPEVEDLEDFAAGVCAEERAKHILAHVADCRHCAPLVRTYLHALEEEEEVREPKPALFPATRHAARPTLIARPAQWFTVDSLTIFALRRVGPIFALAGMTILAIVAGQPMLNIYELHRTQTLIAAASSDTSAGDVRLSWSPYPKDGGVRRRDPQTPPSPADYPSLSAASSQVAGKMYSSDPRWIRLRGRVKLLLHENADAVKLLSAAVEQGLNDPDTQIDLAVAHFERDTRAAPQDNDNKTFNAGESLELLTKVLRVPNLSQEQKAVVLFDLAIIYERMLMWDQAVLTWQRYLDVDQSGPWHDKAVAKLDEAKKKIQPAKPQGYREPSYFLQHVGDPDVQQGLEEYQDIALRTWLAIAIKDANSEAFLATRKLGELLEERHGDTWLSEFLKDLRPDQTPALELLSVTVTYNKQGRYNQAEREAARAAAIFAGRNNAPGMQRAAFEALYASQRLLVAKPCVDRAEALDRKLQETHYRWLQSQTALEWAICLNLSFRTSAAIEQLAVGRRKAKEAGFLILTLRAQALEAAMQVSLNCDATWQLAQTGLEQYWQGPRAPARLYEFYSPVKQCLEKQKLWNAAEAVERQMIAILEKEIDRQDENAVLEATAHSALAQILKELDDDGAAEDQNKLAILLLEKADNIVARTYEIPIKLELADLQLDRGDTEASLATVQGAKTDLEPADDPLLFLSVLRMQGDVHLRKQQWPEAEDDYKRGLEIAEGRFYGLKKERDRQHWTREIGDICRGLVEVLLLQKRDEEALQLWEWFQSRSFVQPFHPRPSEVRWTEIEQTVLSQPLPHAYDTRLVYASTRERLYIWVISSTGIKTMLVPAKRDDLQRLIRQFIRACSTPQDSSMPLPDPDRDSRQLFSLLLEPVLADLHGSDSVIVDLDMAMDGLLVEALKSPAGWYFGQKYPVTYSPGYIRETKLRVPLQDVPHSGLLVNAMGTAKSESKQLIEMFPETAVLDDPAMTTGDLASKLASSDLFVFIGHGKSGKLILENNQTLQSQDFPSKSLSQMELAVLAACSTGLAPPTSQLDTSGLVSAFQAGGTPHVIASRWDVDSNTTTELMISFYSHLKNGTSVPRALFEARKEIFRNPGHRHPYYWAGFVLNGRA